MTKIELELTPEMVQWAQDNSKYPVAGRAYMQVAAAIVAAIPKDARVMSAEDVRREAGRILGASWPWTDNFFEYEAKRYLRKHGWKVRVGNAWSNSMSFYCEICRASGDTEQFWADSDAEALARAVVWINTGVKE